MAMELEACIGFGGSVPCGLHAHPGEEDIIYPLGSTVVVKNIRTNQDSFLLGLNGRVSCIAVSRSGRFVAAGEETHMGFQATAVIWDFETRSVIHRCTLHKGKVQMLDFSPDERFLATVGGIDDSTLVIWDMASGQPVCGAQGAGGNMATCLAFCSTNSERFITAGEASIRVWEMDLERRKLVPTDCQLGHSRRIVTCMVLDPADEYAYCGTTTGDVLAINIRTRLFKQLGPPRERDRFQLGVRSIALHPNGNYLLVGSGSGTVAAVCIGDLTNPKTALRVAKTTSVLGGVTSLRFVCRAVPPPSGTGAVISAVSAAQSPSRRGAAARPARGAGVSTASTRSAATSRASAARGTPSAGSTAPRRGVPGRTAARPAMGATRTSSRATPAATPVRILCGTAQSHIYSIEYPTLEATLLSTCHTAPISDIAFPAACSELFATCSSGDLRIWNARTCAELLRIQVDNVTCNCVCFSPDGAQVLSGWSDGKIRGFGPESGTLLFVINDAHKSVTAIAPYRGQPRIITGGSEGQVRVWQLNAESQVLVSTMKEHRATVNQIALNGDDTECLSASADSSCVIWDLTRFKRANTLLASTVFKGIAYAAEYSQILTAGTDHNVFYWDALDATTLRELQASDAELAALAIDSESRCFATGGSDKLVRVWLYDEGTAHAEGRGHSGAVTKIAFAPDNQHIVSVGDEGAILIWRNPVL